MKKKLLPLLLILMASTFGRAQNTIQMLLPPHGSTFPGNVRGYWFTSPTCFTITGLEVPTDASTGLQNIALVRFNTPVPVYSATSNDFTVLFLTQNDTTTGMIPVNIQVGPGEIIGILGNRDNNNSYATSPFTSSINGFPVTLTRLGMQFNLSSVAPQNLWTEVSGNISRVWMYYDTTFTFNVTQTWQGGTNYSFTNGTGPTSVSVWDYGDGSPLDTAYNPSHTFPSPGNYTVCSYITGTCVSDTVCTSVIICPAPALADYTYSITYPTVDFTDVSQNAASYLWDFGDGNTSTQQNPSHIYSTFGLYTICLSVTDTCGGVNTICKNISVCPALLPVSLGTDTAACGSAVISLPGYTTYTWSNGANTPQTTVTSSGDYAVVVTDAAGCSGTDTVNVTINPVPVVSLGNDSVSICGGNAITLDAQNPGSTYLWSNGATTQTISVTTTNLYSVTVTNSFGCSASDATQATIFPIPNVFLGNDLNICQGIVSINAGNPGSTYLWNTGATTQSILVNTGGTYFVKVTSANACTSSDTISIVMNAPAVTYVETQTLVCVNAAPITLTPGTPSGGSYSGPGVTGNTFNPTAAGLGNKNIIYAYTDTAGCIGRDTSIITVDPCAGIGEVAGSEISIYPNPGTGLFELKLKETADLIIISDSYGREIRRINPSANQYLLDMSKEAAGVYILNVKMREANYTLPFVIAR